MRLVVVRHLPTEWNLAEKLQGRADISISPPDERELERIRENRGNLEKLGPFEKVVCSTLKRTEQTAHLHGYEAPEKDPLLDEFDFGPYEGALKHEFLAAVGEAWVKHPETITLGESMVDFEKRVRQFIKANQGYGNILAFTHGCWCRAVKSIHDTGTVHCMNQIVVRNNEINVFDF